MTVAIPWSRHEEPQTRLSIGDGPKRPRWRNHHHPCGGHRPRPSHRRATPERSSAWLLAQRAKFPEGPWAPIAFAFYAATVGLLLLQPDVGQSALLTAGFVIVFFVSGLPWLWAAAFTEIGRAHV